MTYPATPSHPRRYPAAKRSVTIVLAPLVAVAVALGLGATPAYAAPILEVELTRDADHFPVVHRSDDRVDYTAQVTNSAGPFAGSAEIGDTLRCQTGTWTPAAAQQGANPAVAYEWRRDGQVIPGATDGSYTVSAPDDAGKTIQCVMIGTNASATVRFAALNPVAVTPLTLDETPTATSTTVAASRPTITGTGTAPRTCAAPTNWEAPAGTGLDESDFDFKWLRNGDAISGQTTNAYAPSVATGTATRSLLATGTGDRSLLASATADRAVGSRVLTSVTNVASFTVGASLSGTGIPEGTTIAAIDVDAATITMSQATGTSGPAGPIASGSRVLTNVTGSFAVGESITGTGIPENTTVTAGGAGTLTLSRGVVSAGTATALVSGSRTLTGFSTTTGTFAVGDVITGTGFGPATKVTAIDNDAGTITLSKGVTAAGTSAIAGGADNGTVLQCEVTGAFTGGGSTVGISNSSTVGTVTPLPPNNLVAQTATILDPNAVDGPVVTVEVELPPGASVYYFYASSSGTNSPETPSPNGWSCAALQASGADPARGVCTRSTPLSPGASYPVFRIAAALSADMPDTATATATVSGGGAPPAHSEPLSFDFAPALRFGFASFETFVQDEADSPVTQAGGHPFKVGARFGLNGKRALRQGHFNQSGFGIAGTTLPVGSLRSTLTDTPAGFVGSARAIEERCATVLEVAEGTCSTASVVGELNSRWSSGASVSRITVYAMEPDPGRAAQFAAYVELIRAPLVFYPRLRPDGGYAMTIESAPAPRGEPRVVTANVTLCSFGAHALFVGGNPRPQFGGCKSAGDPDPDGGGPLTAAFEKPLVTLPPRCGPTPPTTVFHADSWEAPGVFASASFTDPALTGCELVQFDPSIAMSPSSTAADSASGLDVELSMPADGLEDPEGISQAHLRKTVVELPDGVSVNPSAATGLAGCSDAQLALGTDDEPTCPDGSKVATVDVTTPLLEETLSGHMVLRTPTSTVPESGGMLRMALVVRNDDRGLLVKLPGSATADPGTGRITATFDENPELPIGTVKVKLKGGDRGVLAMPQRCGPRAISSELSPWKGAPNVNANVEDFSDPFVVGGDCSFGFAPKLDAGMGTQSARGHGKFSFKFSRRDGEQWLRGLTAKLPKGLLASVKHVDLCTDAQAAAGTCPLGSQIGVVDARAGSGDPFVLEQKGRAYLTEGYKGGEYGLAVKIRPVAGPFRDAMELSPIIVRQAIHVDRKTAQVTAVSDPFPLIHHGVPLRAREVLVKVDRPSFMLNPSDCSPKQVQATVLSAEGTRADVANHFQAVNCTSLPFKPRLAMRLVGRRQMTTGKHPAIRALVRQRGVGEAGIERAQVRLPKSLALDPANAQALCEFEDGTKPDLENHCPRGSIVGRARAVSPLLNDPLVGNVYFVKNIRIDPDTGNEIRTLPMIVTALRGEISVNLTGESSTTKSGKLVNTFADVPDAPISRFNLNIKGGRNGIIAVTRSQRRTFNLCRMGRQVAEADMDGQNGKRHDFNVVMRKPCPRRATPAQVCRKRTSSARALRACVRRVKQNRAKRAAAQRAANRRAAARRDS